MSSARIAGLRLGHRVGLGGIVREVHQDHQGLLRAERVGQGRGGQDLEAGDARRGSTAAGAGPWRSGALDADAVPGQQIEAGRDAVQRPRGRRRPGQDVVIQAAAIRRGPRAGFPACPRARRRAWHWARGPWRRSADRYFMGEDRGGSAGGPAQTGSGRRRRQSASRRQDVGCDVHGRGIMGSSP